MTAQNIRGKKDGSKKKKSIDFQKCKSSGRKYLCGYK